MSIRHLARGSAAVVVLAVLASCGSRSRVDAVVNTVGGDYAAAQINRGIQDLKMYKDVEKGTQSRAGYPHIVGKRYLVRLFDKNGQYLTHFTTESLIELMGREELTRKHFEFTYDVNLRDLQVAERAEFGGVV